MRFNPSIVSLILATCFVRQILSSLYCLSVRMSLISRLYGADNSWHRFSGICSKLQSNIFNTDTEEGTKQSVRIIEVEFVWNLLSLGPSELSTIERCPYYRGGVCMEFGLFRTKRTVYNREVSVL